MAEYFPFDVNFKSYSGSFSGSFFGDGSGLTNVKSSNISGSVTSASYAATASLLLGSVTSASYAATASFLLGSIASASYATTASFATNGGVTQLLAGPNITLSPTDGKGQVTVSATLSGSTIFNTATGSYGSFYDTTTQTNPVGNVPRSMSFDSTDITNGVSISGSTNPFNTYIKTTNAGVYNIQFSAQIDKTDSGADEIVIWLRKNGIDLTDTATTLTLSGNNDKKVAAWNWFVTSAANDYYQIIWLSADTDLRLLAEPISGTHPGIPSVILTANRVDQFLSNTGSFSGSFNGSFTGSLFGTASWATNALTASFINTASTNAFVQGGNSFGAQAVLGTNDNQSLAFETSGSTRMFISSSGRVGIGTITPLYTLDTVGNVRLTNAASQLIIDNATYSELNYGASNYFRANGAAAVINGPFIQFLTGGTERMRFSSGGNLLIGTTTDSARLTVRGSGATSSTTALRVENTNASASLVVLDNGAVGIGTNTPISRLSVVDNNGYSPSLNATASANFNVSRGTTGATNLVFTLSGSSPFTAAIQHRHAAVDGISYAISLNPLGGNVGIGTNAPTRTLQVVGGDVLIDNNKGYFSKNTGGSELSLLKFDTSNNCQIGSVFQGGGTIIYSTAETVFYSYPGSVLTERMRIANSTGNVLIGTTTDAGFKLDVSGSGRFTNGLTVTGSLIAPSITGSLQGTASYATQALSASWAPGGAASTTGSFTGSFTGSLLGTIRVVNVGGAAGVMYPLIGSFFNGDVTVHTIDTPDYKYDVTNNQLKVSSVSGSFTGSLQGTASYATQALSASWAPGGSSTPTFPYTGSATISGSLVITGSFDVGVPGTNSPRITSVGTLNRGDIISVDWSNRNLIDTSTTSSIDWENRSLYDTTGVISVDWTSRVLSEGTGTWTSLDYSNDTYLSSQLYYTNTVPAQVQRAVADTPLSKYGGQSIQATVDVGVTDFQLVYLDTDGTWKVLKNLPTVSTKMVGINIDGLYVMIEGDIGVSDDNSQGAYVIGADHGLPVYISDTNGVMTTTVPTSGVVRILGHVYYNSSTDINWWTMKFRPSNDWYEI